LKLLLLLESPAGATKKAAIGLTYQHIVKAFLFRDNGTSVIHFGTGRSFTRIFSGQNIGLRLATIVLRKKLGTRRD
jgi:hypothetical protein